jgi:ribonucleoside-triphosphate reductase
MNQALSLTLPENNGISYPISVIKRNGSIVLFDREKIKFALQRCFSNINQQPKVEYDELVNRVIWGISGRLGTIPTVEAIQDIVEMVLMTAGEFDAAKNYILYREKHKVLREDVPV